ncbi:MAG: hypothetical protein U9Q80_07860 [Bacillota bacterium]|nr:hypothetical protein [Bacillota bacterium]
MDLLEILQFIKNLIYYSVISYLAIIMMVKAEKWQKKNGKDIKLSIYSFVVLMLLFQSMLWDRSMLTASFLMFGFLPILVLFNYQKKDYEPDFTWTEYFTRKKFLIVVFAFLIVVQWPLNRLIAGELLKEHHQWVAKSIESDEFFHYNQFVVSTYDDGEVYDYLLQYNQEDVQINSYTGTQINFQDEYQGKIVSIHYRLDGAKWMLAHIDLIER